MSQFPETIVTRNPETHLCQYDFSAYSGLIPGGWVSSLERYFNEGIETGGFLRAVLENDFQTAIRSCSLHCSGELNILRKLLDLLAEGAPSQAWGSRTAVEAWLALWAEGGVYRRALELKEKPTEGATSICWDCKRKIVFDGSRWKHEGNHQPRHPAAPVPLQVVAA